MERATGDLPAGRERLRRGAVAYLDACLDHRAVKALLIEARMDGSLTNRIASRGDAFTAAAQPSFRALGWRDGAYAARLFAAMTSEVALLELDAGKAIPAARRTLARFLEPPA